MAKFAALIGNPPYQQDPEQGSTRALPIYPDFMDEAFKVAERVELVTPARFLFDSGQTKKDWNRKMLSDRHFKVLHYEPDSGKVFNGVDIKGGVAVTLHDETRQFEPIDTFIADETLAGIVKKAGAMSEYDGLTSIVESQNNYDFDVMYAEHPEYKEFISGEGKHSQLKSNALVRVPIFTDEKQAEDDLGFWGLDGRDRVCKWAPARYIKRPHPNLMKHKVLVAASNGSGAFGEVLAGPFVVGPGVGYTQTFIGIGAFDTEEEAKALPKYLRTKFLRALLGTLKKTQHNTAATWKLIPLQDFTADSDIDWSRPVPLVDEQLYQKYGLSEDEVSYIEENVKEYDMLQPRWAARPVLTTLDKVFQSYK